MGFLDRLIARDREQADTRYANRESATDRAARKRRENHRARVIRDGDDAGTKIPRSLRRKAF